MKEDKDCQPDVLDFTLLHTEHRRSKAKCEEGGEINFSMNKDIADASLV